MSTGQFELLNHQLEQIGEAVKAIPKIQETIAEMSNDAQHQWNTVGQLKLDVMANKNHADSAMDRLHTRVDGIAKWMWVASGGGMVVAFLIGYLINIGSDMTKSYLSARDDINEMKYILKQRDTSADTNKQLIEAIKSLRGNFNGNSQDSKD